MKPISKSIVLLALVILGLGFSACSKKIVWQYDTRAKNAINPFEFDSEKLGLLILDEVNRVRKRQNRGVLQPDNLLFNAAIEQNDYILKEGKLTHIQKNSSDKKTVADRVKLYDGDYDMVGENLQYQGFTIAKKGRKHTIIYMSYEQLATKIVQAWVSSPAHYKNMLTKEFTHAGTAVALDTGKKGIYATQVLGTTPN